MPASGTLQLDSAYSQGATVGAVQALAASAEDALGAPAVDITSPKDGATISGSSVTVTGTAHDSGGIASLTVDGHSVRVNDNGTWSTTVSLSKGRNEIDAVAKDDMGNTSTASVTVTATSGSGTPGLPPPPDPPANLRGCQVPPKLHGQPLKVAKRAILKWHCRPGKVVHAWSKTVVRGRVIGSRPKAGTHLKAGTHITILQSKGKKPKTAPKPARARRRRPQAVLSPPAACGSCPRRLAYGWPTRCRLGEPGPGAVAVEQLPGVLDPGRAAEHHRAQAQQAEVADQAVVVAAEPVQRDHPGRPGAEVADPLEPDRDGVRGLVPQPLGIEVGQRLRQRHGPARREPDRGQPGRRQGAQRGRRGRQEALAVPRRDEPDHAVLDQPGGPPLDELAGDGPQQRMAYGRHPQGAVAGVALDHVAQQAVLANQAQERLQVDVAGQGEAQLVEGALGLVGHEPHLQPPVGRLPDLRARGTVAGPERGVQHALREHPGGIPRHPGARGQGVRRRRSQGRLENRHPVRR